MSVLVVLEQRAIQGPPAWNRMSWETLAAGAAARGASCSSPSRPPCWDQGIESLAAELAG